MIKKLYVVSGDPIWIKTNSPSDKFKEPDYSTNPLDYNLDVFDTPVTQEEYESEYKDKVKAFINVEDAIDFAYSCNLDGVIPMAYSYKNKEWKYDSKLTESEFDIDW